MATINVRQLEDSVVERLKQIAMRNNRSLEGEARHILKSAVEDDLTAKRTAFLAESERLRRTVQRGRQTPAESLIREDRDQGHSEV